MPPIFAIIKKTLENSAKLVLKSFKPVFLVGFILALSNQICFSILPPLRTAQDLNASNINPVQVMLIFGALLVLTTAANAMIQLLLVAHSSHKSLTLRGALHITLNRLPRLLAASIVFSAILLLGLMLYILPGIIFAAAFFLYQPIIIFENSKVIDAFKQSIAISKPNFIFAFAVLITAYACLLLPQMLIQEITKAFPAIINIDKVLDVFVMAIMLPFANAIIVTAYGTMKQLSEQSQENVAIR